MQDDIQLIKRLQEQDSKALSAIYDRYSGAIYGVIFRICKNKDQAEDLLQETFLKIWQKSYLYDPNKGKFFTWAYRIAKNTTLNAVRKSSKLIQNEDLSVYEGIGDTGYGPDYLELDGSLKKLDAHHQEALRLVYFGGLTHREAHEEMGVPLGTFKSYIKQALKKLRETYKTSVFLWCILFETIG